MAYVNVGEWTNHNVIDWLKGLDDAVQPYVEYFRHDQVNGCRLLTMDSRDLCFLNVNKIGHQEIILEGVELLRHLHYGSNTETLQTILLKLACKARSMYNNLRVAAATAKAAADAKLAAESQEELKENEKSKRKHKEKKDKGKKKDKVEPVLAVPEPERDLSPMSTTTLYVVAEILVAVKEFISWIDRYPFDHFDKYGNLRKQLLDLSTQLASTAQRDRFVEGPNEIIRECCKQIADSCDRMVQGLTDPLSVQAATLEVVAVIKNLEEELGMHIHSSYSGIHVVGGLKFNSPAHRHGVIEEGDEIIQVNYQTVVGWQLNKLVASMRQFPKKLILTIKKRPVVAQPRNQPRVAAFSLPTPQVPLINMNHLPNGSIPPSIPQLSTPLNYLPTESKYDQNSMVTGWSSTLANQSILSTDVTIPATSNTTAPLGTHSSNTCVTGMSYLQASRANTIGLPWSQLSAMQPELSSQTEVKQFVNTGNSIRASMEKDRNQYDQTKFKTNNAKTNGILRESKKNRKKSADRARPVRQITQLARCSSMSECSLSDLSDESSAMYTSDSDSSSESDHCIQEKKTKELNNNVAQFYQNKSACSSSLEDEEGNDDNDSAFYSGRRTDTSPSTVSKSNSKQGASSVSSVSSTSSTSKVLTNSFNKLQLKNTASLNGNCQERMVKSETGNDSTDSGIREREEESLLNEKVEPSKPKDDRAPRTSAEFEALFLRQVKSDGPTRSSTLPPNSTPSVVSLSSAVSSSAVSQCTQSNQSRSVGHSPLKAAPSFTSVQLSTISHLTSLARNIRFANTGPVGAVQHSITNPCAMNLSAAAASSPHTKSSFDRVLANRIARVFQSLAGEDLVMGNFEDSLYFYKGTERVNGNNLERVPSLGIITDQVKMDKWTHVRAFLRDHCFYVQSEGSSKPLFELPIHLPGYYILVDKSMILNVDGSNSNQVSNTEHSTARQLFVFKLVTYHRLFLFASESLSKVIQWISRFGYRFCCNPKPEELCFTYYLSATHVNEGSSAAPRSNTVQNGVSCDKKPNDGLELESDDYHDLSIASVSSESLSNTVKFAPDSKSEEGGEDEETRQFIKTPHPRGSARFSVCPPPANQCEFIDSVVDSKKTLAAAAEEQPNPAQSENQQLPDLVEPQFNFKQVPPQLPPRTNSLQPVVNKAQNIGFNADIPKPKPRISKMAITGGQSPSKTANLSHQCQHRLATATEKSAVISQTIQHFANLQRQNNLRRSFAQQQQQQQQQQQNSLSPLKCRPPKTDSKSMQPINYADYDYIINRSLSQSKVESVASITQPMVGNPLYQHVPTPNFEKNITSAQSETQSKEKNEKEGNTEAISDESDECEPLLPPTIQPPPLPAVAARPSPSPLNEGLESDDGQGGSTNKFGSSSISSPKVQVKRKKHPPPPPVPVIRQQSDNNSNDDDKCEKQITPPPTLLPRRPINSSVKLTPPPLPTTAHPFKVFSSMGVRSKPPTSPPPPPPIIAPKPEIAKCGSKFLNRSYSDVAYRRSVVTTNGNNERTSRPSIGSCDSGHTTPEPRLSVVSDQNEDGSVFDEVTNPDEANATQTGSMVSQESSGTAGSAESSPTGRTLPTMGVSMLAKKRLSNVSADCSAVEKAVSLHRQLSEKTDRRPSVTRVQPRRSTTEDWDFIPSIERSQ